jgi:hypothetical protein
MTPQDLIDQFRLDVGDSVEPYLWSTAELVSYAASAEFALVRGLGGILDRSSAATQAVVTAGNQFVPKHPAILDVIQAYLAGEQCELDIVPAHEIDMFDAQPGPVMAMAKDGDDASFVLDTLPEANDTLRLVVFRLPLKRVTDESARMEVADKHFDGMLLGVKARAYMKDDAETFDRSRAADFEARFAAYVTQAMLEVDRIREPVRTVRYGGY